MANTIGLDISSTKIGIAVLGKDDELLHSDIIKFKSDLPLEDRAAIFESIMRKLNSKYLPYYVFIEEAAMMFSSGSTAHVMSKLQGSMVCVATLVEKRSRKMQYKSMFARLARLWESRSSTEECSKECCDQLRQRNLRRRF